MGKIALGSASEASQPDAIRAALAEFIATFLFVFAGVGSAIAYGKLLPGDLTPAGLVAIALAHGIALFVVIAATANVSGGHVNPAVTFGLALGGHITILRGALYWIAQLLGSTAASLVLKYIVTGEVLCLFTHWEQRSQQFLGSFGRSSSHLPWYSQSTLLQWTARPRAQLGA
ncbi:hypothetical protein O6H91_Y463800 [Diphasiastrum complanatum]|nr:hypothetical protein O6H91_Y463800 [Diphasiastrum complanatum]